MSLRRRALAILGMAAFLSVILIYGTGRLLLLDAFLRLDDRITRQYAEQARDGLLHELSALDDVATDYAARDSAYRLMQTRDAIYVKSELASQRLQDRGVDFIALVDPTGRLVYGRATDSSVGRDAPLPDDIKQHFSPRGVLLRHPGLNGVLLLAEGAALVSSKPITTSRHEGPTRGALIIGRFIDPEQVKRLAAVTHLATRAYRLDQAGLPADVQRAVKLLADRRPLLAVPLDDQSIAGYALVNDVYGKPALALKTTLPRSVYQQGKTSLDYFLLFCFAAFAVGVALTVWLLDKSILSRVTQLTQGIKSVGATGDLTRRVPVRGNDEISSLALTLNEMLEALDQSRRVRASEQRYRQLVDELWTSHQQMLEIIEFLPDATFVIGRDNKVVAWNKAMEDLTGVRREDIINQDSLACGKALHGSPRPVLADFLSIAGPSDELYASLQRDGNSLRARLFLPLAFGGRGAHVEAMASLLRDHGGETVGVIESIRDVAPFRSAAERSECSKPHDDLAELGGPELFRRETEKWRRAGTSEAGVVLCQVDHLKVVNLRSGMEAGNKLLTAAVGILKAVFGDQGTLVRLTGDELVVVVAFPDRDFTKTVPQRIREAVERSNHSDPARPPLSLSVGAAVSKGTNVELPSLVVEAKERQFESKLGDPDALLDVVGGTFLERLAAAEDRGQLSKERLLDLTKEALREVLAGPDEESSGVAGGACDEGEAPFASPALHRSPKRQGEVFREASAEELAVLVVGRELAAVTFSRENGIPETTELFAQVVNRLPVTRDMALRLVATVSAVVVPVAQVAAATTRQIRLLLVDNGESLLTVFEAPPPENRPDPAYRREQAHDRVYAVRYSPEALQVAHLVEHVLWHAFETHLTVVMEFGYRRSSAEECRSLAE
ncbi:MAG: CHASE4 domain-containing protein [Methanocella sp.]